MCIPISIHEATEEQQPGVGRVAVAEGTQGEVFFYSQKQRIYLSKIIDIPGLINKVIDQLFNKGKLKRKTNNELLKRAYQPLKEAVNEGFVAKVEFGTPNYEFLKQLQYNASTFAAFKNHAQIKDMTALLVDENGKRRTKEAFKKKALEIDSKYNTHYLDVEYDTAVRQARSAAQWQQALTTKHLFPNIKYLRSVSANKREEHQTYYGLIRPIDDPIWNIILPVNAWGCKCSWEVTDEGVTDIPDDLEAPQKGFEFNAGKTGQIFQLDSTGYAKAVPKATKEELIKHAKKVVDFEMAADLPYINVYDSKSGTDVFAHPLAFDNGDFQAALTAARKLANAKKVKIGKIEILPTLFADVAEQKKLRQKLLLGVKDDYNPDYRIDNSYVDLKEVLVDKINPNRTIGDKLSEANRQADGIVLVIENTSVITKDMLYRNINGRFNGKFKDAYKAFKLYLKYGDEWLHFTQQDWIEFYQKYKK